MASTNTNIKKPYCDRISAFWDNEKSSPSVVPRLLYMEIDQLSLTCPSTPGVSTLGSAAGDPTGPSSSSSSAGPVYLAIKMPAQRALRSQQIPPPAPSDSCAQDRRILVEIQYPHCIKRDNPLLVMLQRRRKYRNLGFKTLGAAFINLTDILQMRLLDARLPLLPDFETAQRKQQSLMMKHQQQPIGYLHVVRLETLPAPVPGTAVRAGKSADDDYLAAASDDDEAVADEEEAAAVAAAAVAAKAKKEALFGAKPREWRQKLKLFMDESFSTILKSRKLKPEHNYELELHQDESLWHDLDDIEPPDSSSSLDDDDDVSIGSTPKPSVRRYFGSQSSDCRLAQQQQQQLHQSQQPQPPVRQAHSWAHHQPSVLLTSPMDQQQHLLPLPQSSEPTQQSELPVSVESGGGSDAAAASVAAEPATAVTETSPPPTTARRPSQEMFSPPAAAVAATTATATATTTTTTPPTPSGTSAKLPPSLLVPQTHALSVTDPRKECTEAVAKLHGDCLPEKLCLINTGENGGRALLEALQQPQDSPGAAAVACIPAVTAADCRHVLAHISASLGHQTSAAAGTATAAAAAAASAVHRICIVGSDSHVNAVLRAYVEQFGSKPAAWQSRVRFYYAPLLGSAALARLLCSADSPSGYAALWGDCTASAVESGSGWSAAEAAQRIRRYLAEADTQLRLPVGEVLLAESADGAQTFVPFVLHVRLGQADRGAESDSELPTAAEELHQQQQVTPPGSPIMESSRPVISGAGGGGGSDSSTAFVGDFVDLQLDYWTGGSDRRTALKPALRALRVCQAASGRGLSLSLVNKRQKIMRLGKKAKEAESRREVVDGLTRLICTGKSHPMRVFVDGVEWSGVKFFQLSSQWQTSVKFLPVAVYSLSQGSNGVSYERS